MYKICVALVAMLAVAAAKPSLGYSYATPYSQAYSVAPVAPAISAYSAPAIYPAQPIYSSLANYAAPYAAAPYTAASYTPIARYAPAPLAQYAPAPLTQYAPAALAQYAPAPLIAEPYSAYPYSYAQNYASALEYGFDELPLLKKK